MAIIIGGQAIEGPKETISLDDFLEHVQDDVLHPNDRGCPASRN